MFKYNMFVLIKTVHLVGIINGVCSFQKSQIKKFSHLKGQNKWVQHFSHIIYIYIYVALLIHSPLKEFPACEIRTFHDAMNFLPTMFSHKNLNPQSVTSTSQVRFIFLPLERGPFVAQICNSIYAPV